MGQNRNTSGFEDHVDGHFLGHFLTFYVVGLTITDVSVKGMAHAIDYANIH